MVPPQSSEAAICPNGEWIGKLERAPTWQGRALILNLADTATGTIYAIPLHQGSVDLADYQYAQPSAEFKLQTRATVSKGRARVVLEKIEPHQETAQEKCYRIGDELQSNLKEQPSQFAATQMENLCSTVRDFPPAILWVANFAHLTAPHAQHWQETLQGLTAVFGNQRYIRLATAQGDRHFSNLIEQASGTWKTMVDAVIATKDQDQMTQLSWRLHDIISLVPEGYALRQLAETSLPEIYKAIGMSDPAEEKRLGFTVQQVMQAMTGRRLEHEGHAVHRDARTDHNILGRFFLAATREA